MSGLMLESGAERVSRGELFGIPTPEATATWKPVPHYEAAEMVAREAQRRGYAIAGEEYGLSKDGSKMFGVIKFHYGNSVQMTRCLGVRNSHDKSLALGLTVGLNVIVCSNLCFGGEVTINRKHTNGIDLEALIPEAFDNLGHQFIRLEHRVEELQDEKITVNKARIIAVMAAESKAIPSCDIVPVVDEFRNPSHYEFEDRNKWSLYNAFTEVAKKYSPARGDQCYRRLGNLFELS